MVLKKKCPSEEVHTSIPSMLGEKTLWKSNGSMEGFRLFVFNLLKLKKIFSDRLTARLRNWQVSSRDACIAEFHEKMGMAANCWPPSLHKPRSHRDQSLDMLFITCSMYKEKGRQEREPKVEVRLSMPSS